MSDRTWMNEEKHERERATCLAYYYNKKKSDPDYIRRMNLRRRFDLSLEEYERMFVEQHGLCAICQQVERRLGKDGLPLPLCVDHDHTNKTVRQLLCNDCNTAIGLLKEDVLRLQAAINYLLKHRGYDGGN